MKYTLTFSNLCPLFSLQFHSRQPDESGHHAFRGEPWCSHHPPQPLPQLPPASSQHAWLQPGEHSHHWPCHGPSAADPRRAARRRGGAAGPDSGISRSLQRHHRHLQWGEAGQEDKKRTNRLMQAGWMEQWLSWFFFLFVCFFSFCLFLFCFLLQWTLPTLWCLDSGRTGQWRIWPKADQYTR